MRAIICGTGAAGLLHALSLRAHGVHVIGVFDPRGDRARALAEMCGARVFDSVDALAAEDAEIACICGPPRVHAEQAERIAREGRIVFVEKPVATTREELARLAALPGCSPVVQWRQGRAMRAIRAAIARGMLGPSPVVAADLALSRGAPYFAEGRARRDDWGCGALLSVGIHAIDAFTWAIGRRLASASGAVSFRPGIEVETSAVVAFAFEGGALASLRITFEGGPDKVHLSFCGGGITAEIAGDESDPTARAVAWSSENARVLAAARALEEGAGGALGPPLMVPFLGGAIEAIRRGHQPGDCDALLSIADVRDAHEAVLRIYEGVEARSDVRANGSAGSLASRALAG